MVSQTLLRAYPVPYIKHESGGFCLSAGDHIVSVPQPSNGVTGHSPFWSKPISRFGFFSLDGIYQQFTFINPLTQPSVSTGFRLPVSRSNFHKCCASRGMTTLLVRSAPSRYQLRTAPRLLKAEQEVALSSCDDATTLCTACAERSSHLGRMPQFLTNSRWLMPNS